MSQTRKKAGTNQARSDLDREPVDLAEHQPAR